MAGGMTAGILSNPFEIVFKRMQVDEMYPEQCRRNYKSFADGIVKVAEEGALFRGAVVNGLKIGGMMTIAAGFNDWMKENTYYFFGPIMLTRILGTAAGTIVAVAMSMPFDAIATRMHTMRPLPNGMLPYSHALHCFSAMLKYECNPRKFSHGNAFYAGAQAYSVRLFSIALLSQYLLDRYHATDNVSEFWQPSRFHVATGIDYDIHNPYTDGFN